MFGSQIIDLLLQAFFKDDDFVTGLTKLCEEMYPRVDDQERQIDNQIRTAIIWIIKKDVRKKPKG